MFDQAARDAYGRLVAWLAGRFGNLADAEDAVSDALEAALTDWPKKGLPRSPEAWLLTTARRRLLDRVRHSTAAGRSAEVVRLLSEERLASTIKTIPDDRLRLMLVCAHPAINVSMRAPLMLQCVLGLDARRISNAFLVAPGTMGIRLVRAKAKIATAGIPFSLPDDDEMPSRMTDVLDAIYAAYTLGRDAPAQQDIVTSDLAVEALWLVSILARLAPQSDETHGLFALILFGLGRRSPKVYGESMYVPLSEQDPSLWNAQMLVDANRALRNAQRGGTMGRYQLEAAIEAAQIRGQQQGKTDWDAILVLYHGLEAICPTMGVACGRIAALAHATSDAQGLAALDALTHDRLALYQPYWALRAHLLSRLGNYDAASKAFAKAAALTENTALKSWLQIRARGPQPR
jgi:RNA polymerase sigma-70 factor, ECF subfamily